MRGRGGGLEEESRHPSAHPPFYPPLVYVKLGREPSMVRGITQFWICPSRIEGK